MGKRAPFIISCPVVVTHKEYPDRIVLVEEPKKGYSFNLPGGGLDLLANKRTETIFACAIREVLEESGLEVDITGFLGLDHIEDESKLHITLAAIAMEGALKSSPEHPSVRLSTLEEIEIMDQEGRLRSPRVLIRARQFFSGLILPADEVVSLLSSDPIPHVVKRLPTIDSPISDNYY
jgi:ADP-ribose pyrophosphatase YjhB (NUDIX family)